MQQKLLLEQLLLQPPSRYRWAQLPTPVRRATWLDYGDSEVWIKHDEVSSPIYGGGKVRKLEWVLANPPHNDDQPIVTLGAIGSHHLVATGLFLRQLDRQLHAIIFDQVPTQHALTNLAVLASIGTKFWYTPTRATLAIPIARYYLGQTPKNRGHYLTAGASTPLGSFGFVEAGLELGQQIQSGEMPHPKHIYIAAGSAGSCAGLAIGLALANINTTLHLVSAVEPLLFNNFLFLRTTSAVYKHLRSCGLEKRFPHRVPHLLQAAGLTLAIDHSQVGDGYAIPTAAGEKIVRLAGQHHLTLEPTYTGKCFAAYVRDAEARNLDSGPVLLWNTHANQDLTPYIHKNWYDKIPHKLATKLLPYLQHHRLGSKHLSIEPIQN